MVLCSSMQISLMNCWGFALFCCEISITCGKEPFFGVTYNLAMAQILWATKATVDRDCL